MITTSTDVYALTTIQAGGVRVDEGRHRWAMSPMTAGLYRPPKAPRRNRIAARTEMTYLQIDRRDLERHLEELIEDHLPGPVDFSPRLSLHGRPAWLRLLRIFTDVFDHPHTGILRPLVTRPLSEAMINALLYAAEPPVPGTDAAARGDGTVAEAAHRWGFTRLGRFAAAYAEVYGVPPSITRTIH